MTGDHTKTGTIFHIWTRIRNKGIRRTRFEDSQNSQPAAILWPSFAIIHYFFFIFFTCRRWK